MLMTVEQIIQLAPDEAAAAAGRKLASSQHWQGVGQNERALWGLCLGSATYQVKIDLTTIDYKCTCPSRKFPCKHVLGLLMRYATAPENVPPAETPAWVAEWLQKREEKEAKKAEQAKEQLEKPVDERAQQKRAQQRHERVRDGLEQLDLWLCDLIRNGLAGLETKGAEFWEDQARRLVDAQAPGLASRVRKLSDIPASGRGWPRRLLEELGRLKVVIDAYQRIDSLDPDLAIDLRQTIGWTIQQDELETIGEAVADEWLFFGQWVDEDERIRTQRTWCLGMETKRIALLLQFSAGRQPFAQNYIVGSLQHGTMIFYPGRSKQRALFKPEGNPTGISPHSRTVPAIANIDLFLDEVATQLSRQPWLTSFGCILDQVQLTRQNENWFVVDGKGEALPLQGNNQWELLSQTGGDAFAITGEWNGRQLRPLGFLFQGKYRVL
jgi:hypothetical protein